LFEVCLMDVSGNGYLDTLAARATGDSLLIGAMNGTQGVAAVSSVPVIGPIRAIATGDFNGDGSLDVVTASDDFLSFLPSATRPHLRHAHVSYSQEAIGAVAAGDFNRDGHLDVVAAMASIAGIRILYGDPEIGFQLGDLKTGGAIG